MTAVLVLSVLLAAAWAPGRALPAAGRWSRPAGALQRPWRRRGRSRPDLAAVVTEVASRLRAGTAPEAAWTLTVDRLLGPAPPGTAAAGEDGVPAALTRLADHCARDAGARTAARTVVAAGRLTHTLGAPLAEVLERCAATVTEAEHARDARRVALAGPRSTARILAGLPLLGLLLGAGLGTDPLAAATDGGWGSACVLLGLLLLVAGQRWTRSLVLAAEDPAGGEGVGRRSRGRDR